MDALFAAPARVRTQAGTLPSTTITLPGSIADCSAPNAITRLDCCVTILFWPINCPFTYESGENKITTIAANKTCMACDSGVICDETFFQGRPKVFTIGESLVGAAGEVTAINKFLRWMEAGGDDSKRPKFSKDETLRALILNPTGLFQCEDGLEFDQVFSPYFAIGSGEQIALTAMDCGKDPAGAVEAACIRDPNNTKGPVHVFYLKDLPKKAKR